MQRTAGIIMTKITRDENAAYNKALSTIKDPELPADLYTETLLSELLENINALKRAEMFSSMATRTKKQG